MFDAAFRAALAEIVRAVIREELASKPAAEYLSVVRAAEIADVTPGTIRAWIADGRLPRRAAGRVLRVRRSDLDALLGDPGASGTPSPEQRAKDYLAHTAARAHARR